VLNGMVLKSVQPSEDLGPGKTIGRTRIQDVAQAAGVSITSVSNYLNNRHQRLGADARARIAQAISDLGFRPNQAAQQLKTGKKSVIGLVAPSIVNPFNGGMVFAIEQAAFRSGYGVYLCNTMRDRRIERRFMENLGASNVTDLITVAPILSRRGAGPVVRDNLSIVAVDASRADMGLPRVDTINVDHEAAIELAVDHLYELGHRHIAYVTDPIITYSRAMRRSGFDRSMARRDLDASAVLTVERTQDIADLNMVEAGKLAAAQLLSLAKRPTAVVAFNDMIALGLMTELRVAGVSVPKDLSLVGVDDIWTGQLFSPALTSIRQPIEAMAEAAVERIVNPVNSQIGAGSDTTFQPALIVRDTTATVPRNVRQGKRGMQPA
jgi:DNA-binding LacI/PurR family transcriptional regulator